MGEREVAMAAQLYLAICKYLNLALVVVTSLQTALLTYITIFHTVDAYIDSLFHLWEWSRFGKDDWSTNSVCRPVVFTETTKTSVQRATVACVICDEHGVPLTLATLVDAFMTSRVDYCNSLLAALPKYTTDKLQRVLVAAARVITSTRKYDRGLSRLLHEELQHWLDVLERILFKLCVFIHQCLNNKAPRYLMDTCSSVATVPGRQRLRSAGRNYLVVPRLAPACILFLGLFLDCLLYTSDAADE